MYSRLVTNELKLFTIINVIIACIIKIKKKKTSYFEESTFKYFILLYESH